jgi:hypothetical protein
MSVVSVNVQVDAVAEALLADGYVIVERLGGNGGWMRRHDSYASATA